MRDRVKQSRDQALPVAGGIADRIAEDVLQDADADGRPCLGKDQGLVGAIGQDAYGSQQLTSSRRSPACRHTHQRFDRQHAIQQRWVQQAPPCTGLGYTSD